MARKLVTLEEGVNESQRKLGQNALTPYSSPLLHMGSCCSKQNHDSVSCDLDHRADLVLIIDDSYGGIFNPHQSEYYSS